MTSHVLPVPDSCVITQTYAQHVARAKQMGCCSMPAANCRCYYYGAVDLAPTFAASGNAVPVWASADGHVILQNQGSTGYGIHYRLTTVDNELVIFAHLESAVIPSGTKVKQGELLGWMGSTGNSTGKHLHWEIRVNGIPVDPMNKLQEEEDLTIPDFPQPVMYRLKEQYDWLAIRTKPWGTITGVIKNHNPFPVFEVRELDEELWLVIGYNQVCAWKAPGNRVWCEVV